MVIFYIFSFVLTFILVYLLQKTALRFNIVDNPNARKVHENPKALLGGLAIFLGMFITYSTYLQFSYTTSFIYISLFMFILVLVGLYDDIFDMRAIIKLLFQVIIALGSAIVLGGIDKVELYSSIYINFGPLVGILIETLWIIALINAFNLIDGLDGLSAGVGIISLLTLLIMTLIAQDVTLSITITIIIGSLLAFLYFNFYPSTIFLGDSGSMLIGYLIAILSINNYKTVTLTSTMLLLLIAFIPFLDVFLAVLRRKSHRQKAFEADALHFHHRLMRKGLSHPRAVLTMYFIMAFYGIIAILLSLFVKTVTKFYLLLFLGIVTLFIFERLYLLSDKYAYISKILVKVKIFGIKERK